MTKDEIIRMAREAGVAGVTVFDEESASDVLRPELERFAALVAAAEREACAKVCEGRYKWSNVDERLAVNECIAAIRARGK